MNPTVKSYHVGLFLILALLSLSACSRKTVAVPIESAAVHVDTVFKAFRSSDTVKNSDTVIITPEKTEVIRWRIRKSVVHDTVFRIRTDTLIRRIPVTIQDGCRDSWWRNVKNNAFWPLVVIIAISITLLFKQIKRFMK